MKEREGQGEKGGEGKGCTQPHTRARTCMHTHLVVLGARQLDLTEAVEQTRQVAVELDKRNFEGVRELRGHVFQQELNIFLRIRQHHMDDPPQVGCVRVHMCACVRVCMCVFCLCWGGVALFSSVQG